MVEIILRLEGLSIFLACLYFYNNLTYSFLFFVIVWLVPDLSMIGYLRDKHFGAIIYNFVHNYIFALVFVFWGIIFGNSLITALGIIFVSHVGLDRFLGFGLKKV
jgi:hypothetical protein